MKTFHLLFLALLASLAPLHAAALSGNTISADGTYTVPVYAGQRYTVAIGGTFGSGSLAVLWHDAAGNTGALDGSPATAAENWTFIAPTNQVDLVLTGSTAPSISITITLAGGLRSSSEISDISGLQTALNTKATGYTVPINAALYVAPADAATVYWGIHNKAPSATAATSKIYFRAAGTISIAEIYTYATTAGTAEAWSLYIRKNDTTDYLIGSQSLATNERVWANTAQAVPVVAGDYVEIKSVNPTWATNPGGVSIGGYLYVTP